MIDTIYAKACQTPSDINQHLPLLRQLGEQVSHITEFGVRGICSTWAWVAAKPKTLHLYDIVHPIEHNQYAVCPYTWDDLVLATQGIDFKFYQESTLTCTIEPTDLLFIDTLHTGPQLHQEIHRHHQQVAKFIVLHDTETYGIRGEDPTQPGLDLALIPFLTQHPWRILYRTPTNNGLTVLTRYAH